MSCIDDLELSDYVDGALTGERLREVEDHLAGCATCRSLVEDLQSIQLTARTLETIAPPPYLWTRIAAQLETPPASQGWASLFAWQGLAATAATLVIVTSLAWLGGRLATVPDLPAGPIASEAGVTPSELGAAEVPFTEAIAGLERIAQEGRDSLDPEVAGVLRANLTVIDEAIGQSRKALASEPESEVAQASLVEALRSKVGLLEDTVALINDSSAFAEPTQ
jgi:hypothetical protein